MDDSSQQIATKAFKVILVGSQAVGKSSILYQLINSQIPPSYQATVGIDYHLYTFSLNDRAYSLQIWDTAGQEKFRALTSTYYKNCNGCICVYDLNDPQSIEKVDYYLTKATEENIPQACTFLVGNKSDLVEGEKIGEQGIAMGQKYGVGHETVSAKTGENVAQMFQRLGAKIVGQYGGALAADAVQLMPNLKIVSPKNCSC